MKSPLSQDQVDRIWKTLTVEQQNWINDYTNQRRRDKWFEALALRKGIILQDEMTDEEKRKTINDWELIEILDGGEGNRPFKCECGTTLRYRYTVYHPSEAKTYHLGSTCIENYTGLSADVVRDIQKGIFQINTKRDELLIKIHNQQFIDLTKYIEKGVIVPDSIVKQVEIDIPLFNDQQEFLNESLREIERQEWLEARKKQVEAQFENWHTDHSEYKSSKQLILKSQVAQAEYVSQKDQNRYTYESFISENQYILKQIREREDRLSPKLREEWEWMQDEVRKLKKEEMMDFDTFFRRMNNMMIPLRITR